ncbi:hypothetical protein CROQUDRAFT_726203 [Cronartium quercuum f. sp. fusiforme G11]|uniref:SAP domain-containing protein n=1 Tax=Cronartium quercuum f. sp. fusiforme G11 TaxID=708437 RepID=A0A9P6N6B2_9BASI|nr:hypothetical protein CROQUDRAFT_726203 [Cronartium quercuum f. sp. fusiforme G11]
MHLNHSTINACSRQISRNIHLTLVTTAPISRRSFVSQTLLSRTDFERKTVNELKEELKKRGIATGTKSKSKSVLISKILEDEEQKKGNLPTSSQPHPIFDKNKKSAGPAEVKISSPAPVVARITEEVEKETPVLPKFLNTEEDVGSSAALASPVSNEQSKGHHAETWPARVNLPVTPPEEIGGTVIPFIPDNYESHRQSHAADLTEVTSTSAGLQFSTASHPSTLPEGGPSLATIGKDEEALPSTRQAEEATAFFDQALSDLQARLGELWPSFFSFSAVVESSKRPKERFEFEDRPLNAEERRGLYGLLGLVSVGWLLGGLFAPAPSLHHHSTR